MPKRKAASQADAAVAAEPDYSKMSVAELKAALLKQKLPTSGKKADLIDRLQSASSSTDAAAPPAKKAKGGAAKKAVVPKPEPEPESATGKAVASLKAVTDGAPKKKKKKSPKVDSCFYGGGTWEVVDDYACMLNQTNIGHNNNKYYVIQLLKQTGGFGVMPYRVFTRWGRVGERGDNATLGPFADLQEAEKAFCKKFSAKTSNPWKNRDNFVPKAGKYTLLEMEEDSDDDQAGRLATMDEPDGPVGVKKTSPCSLDSATQRLVKFIFDEDMFKEAMAGLEIDTKKLPLGKLSKTQVLQGFEVLEKIEKKLKGEKMSESMQDLSSLFYTRIPHDFGRQRPPVINSQEVLQKKMDMLMVLADIEMAQSLQEEKKKTEAVEVKHPLDEKYEKLKAKLTPVAKTNPTFQTLQTYLDKTQGYRKLQIQDVFEVDRAGEGDLFAAHDALDNRRLLWHGTNVAVVAAILKTGLRIMPHSGGRVGKGMYFASENGKSANYVRCAKGTGIMFLVEVALGKEHHIERDDWTLTRPPAGKDCIIAMGRTEPDPAHLATLKFDGKDVVVPQGAPIHRKQYEGSSFSQSEYLVYKESQARIRYMLKLKF